MGQQPCSPLSKDLFLKSYQFVLLLVVVIPIVFLLSLDTSSCLRYSFFHLLHIFAPYGSPAISIFFRYLPPPSLPLTTSKTKTFFGGYLLHSVLAMQYPATATALEATVTFFSPQLLPPIVGGNQQLNQYLFNKGEGERTSILVHDWFALSTVVQQCSILP